MIEVSGKLDPIDLRRAFSQFPSSVVALAAEVDRTPVGLIASTFTVGISLNPPLALFAIQNSSTTWPTLRKANHLGASLLGKAQDDVCQQLSSRNKDRFSGLATTTTDGGAIFVGGSAMWLDCKIVEEIPAGDHHIVVFQVEGLQCEPDIEPLVFHQSNFTHLVSAK